MGGIRSTFYFIVLTREMKSDLTGLISLPFYPATLFYSSDQFDVFTVLPVAGFEVHSSTTPFSRTKLVFVHGEYSDI